MERGTFAGHFDALLPQFPPHTPDSQQKQEGRRSAELQEKLDIHAALFEHAWQIDRKDS